MEFFGNPARLPHRTMTRFKNNAIAGDVARVLDRRSIPVPVGAGFLAPLQLGPMARLRFTRAPGVDVLLSSRPLQAADQAIFRHLGVEPAEKRILALKSSVHFRADFEPMASEILVVRSSGANTADPSELNFLRLPRAMRLRPRLAS